MAKREVHSFVRIGEASEDLNAIKDYLGAGVVIEGPFGARPEDQFGIALSSAGVGDPYRETIDSSGGRSSRSQLKVTVCRWRGRQGGAYRVAKAWPGRFPPEVVRDAEKK